MLIEPHVFDAIRDNKVTELNFFSQNLTDFDAIKLAELLEDNSSLLFLDIEYNSLGPKVGFAIAQMLSRNTTLQQLNLRDNRLGEASVRTIIKALQYDNNSLLRLDVKGNTPEFISVKQISINDLEKQNEITQYLDRNKALKFLDNLKQNKVDQSDLLFWNSKVKSGGASVKLNKENTSSQEITVPHTIANLLKEIPPQLKQSQSKDEVELKIKQVLKAPSGSWATFFGNTSLYRSTLLQELKTGAAIESEETNEETQSIPMIEI